MNLFSKRISKKQRMLLEKTIIKNRPPFFNMASTFKNEINLWFLFLERLALTGLLVYISKETRNIALKILVFITLFVWFTQIVTYFYIFESITLKYVMKKSRLWWQFIAFTIVILGILLYFVGEFIDIFEILH